MNQIWWEVALLRYFQERTGTSEELEAATDLWLHWTTNGVKDLATANSVQQVAYVAGAVYRVRRTRNRRWRREIPLDTGTHSSTMAVQPKGEESCLAKQLLSMLTAREAVALVMYAEGCRSTDVAESLGGELRVKAAGVRQFVRRARDRVRLATAV